MGLHTSIAVLVPHYAEVGIKPQAAVHYITESRLAARNARGKGSRAKKRLGKLHYGR